MCIHDGPGIRTTVFFAGCYLHCPWCCNPETLSFGRKYFYNREKCIYAKGMVSALCRDCKILGGEKEEGQCPFGAYKLVSSFYSIEALLQVLLEDKMLYEESGGGVTFSGGEPFFQSMRIIPLAKELRENGINVAIETSGYFPHSHLPLLAEWVDVYIIDLKFQMGFVKNAVFKEDYTEHFYKNLDFIQKQKAQVIYRMVYVPIIMDQIVHRKRIVNSLKQLHISSLQILPYHNLAFVKYQQLDEPMDFFSLPQEEALKSFKRLLEEDRIDCEILTI